MKKVYIKPSVLAQDLCYDQTILTGSPTFNPSDDPSDYEDIDGALIQEDHGIGDDDNSWGWGKMW